MLTTLDAESIPRGESPWGASRWRRAQADVDDHRCDHCGHVWCDDRTDCGRYARTLRFARPGGL